ncbi:MAG: sulfotransferase domain-containing protein [Cyclobacteriaceae bacterium]
MNKINFLVIGVQKSATSWMYYCLQDHPEILLPEKKLEREYIGGELYDKNGLDWYLNKIPFQSNKISGDVSVDYLPNEKSINLLKNHSNSLKFIIMLRNPVERAFSALNWYQRMGDIGLDIDVTQAFQDGISNMDGYKWQERNFDFRDILHRGCYANQISEYLKKFDAKNFLILTYDLVKDDPLKAVSEIYDFLGVNTDHVPTTINKTPKKSSTNNFLVRLSSLGFQNRFIRAGLELAHQVFNKIEKKDKKIDDQLHQLLVNFYSKENTKFVSLIDDKKLRTLGRDCIQKSWK